MYTEEEKAKRQNKHNRKVKFSPKITQALQNKATKAKKAEKAKKAKLSVQSLRSPKASSSFSALMKSWETKAKQRAASEVVEKATSHFEGRSPLQSYLRPANIIWGSFGRTSTGMVPRFVRSYWSRHVAAAA